MNSNHLLTLLIGTDRDRGEKCSAVATAPSKENPVYARVVFSVFGGIAANSSEAVTAE
jgi:hypothetical protein